MLGGARLRQGRDPEGTAPAKCVSGHVDKDDFGILDRGDGHRIDIADRHDHGVNALKAKCRRLLQGLEAEVSIAVDVMLPSGILGRVLEDFRATIPTVTLRINVEALGAVTAKVLGGSAGFAINDPLTQDASGWRWSRQGRCRLFR